MASFSFYFSSYPYLHFEVWRFGLLTHITSSNELPHVGALPWPIEVSQDLVEATEAVNDIVPV